MCSGNRRPRDNWTWSAASVRARSSFMTSAAPRAEDRAPMRLAGATRGEIIQSLGEIGAPERELTMRASQLWHWIYHRGAREFPAMRNIARPLLERLPGRRTLPGPPKGPGQET